MSKICWTEFLKSRRYVLLGRCLSNKLWAAIASMSPELLTKLVFCQTTSNNARSDQTKRHAYHMCDMHSTCLRNLYQTKPLTQFKPVIISIIVVAYRTLAIITYISSTCSDTVWQAHFASIRLIKRTTFPLTIKLYFFFFLILTCLL